jgi:hypothetical protein
MTPDAGKTSRFLYRKRELQSIGCNTCFSVDHTYDTARNFACEAKEVWNAVSGFTEPLAMVLTNGTGLEEFIHALEDLAHRDGFDPTVIFSDTWPAGHECMEAIFLDIKGRLGVLHWMMRITDTLDSSHEAFGDAERALSQVVFCYSTKDHEDVVTALVDGTLNGKRHSTDEIEELIRSGVFKTRYSCYIDHWTHSDDTILRLLNDWAADYPKRVRIYVTFVHYHT